MSSRALSGTLLAGLLAAQPASAAPPKAAPADPPAGELAPPDDETVAAPITAAPAAAGEAGVEAATTANAPAARPVATAGEGPPWDPSAGQPPMVAARRSGPIEIDGDPSEAAWQVARRPQPMYDERSTPRWKQSTQPIEMSVVYDDDAIYFAVWQYVSDPAMVIDDIYGAGGMFFDKGTVLCFSLDPEGGGETSVGGCASVGNQRYTETTLDRGSSGEAWPEPFDYHVRKTSFGYTGEVKLPWSSVGLQGKHRTLQPGLQVISLFPRLGKRYMSAPHISDQINYIPEFNKIAGVTNVAAGRTILAGASLLMAYRKNAVALPAFADWTGKSDDYQVKATFDAKIPLSRTASVSVALAPDFSDTEIEPVFLNLTPFPFFLPERRALFLRKPALFAFGEQGVEQVFYSRRIGLVAPELGAQEVPLYGGGLAVFDGDQVELGGLLTASAPTDVGTGPGALESPTIVDTVLRGRYYPTPALRVGGIYTLRLPEGDTHASAFGADIQSRQADGRLTTDLWVAGSERGAEQGFTAHAGVRWSENELQTRAQYTYNSREFNPALGFYQYLGTQRFLAAATFSPPVSTTLLERVALSADGEVLAATDGQPLRTTLQWSTQTEFRNFASWRTALGSTAETLTSGLAPIGDVAFAAGDYQMTTLSTSITSPLTYPVSAKVQYLMGGLYAGSQQRADVDLNANIGRLAATLNYIYVRARAPSEDVDGDGVLGDSEDLDGDGQLDSGDGKEQLFGARISASPRVTQTVSASVFLSETTFIGQLLGSWEYSPFNFIQLIYSEEAEVDDALSKRAQRRQLLLKLSYNTFRL